MLPYTPPVDVVYPAIGDDVNVFGLDKFTMLEPVRYKDNRLQHLLNALAPILVHEGKFAVIRLEQ